MINTIAPNRRKPPPTTPTPSWQLINTTRLCAVTVDLACLETSSANACYDETFLAYESGQAAKNGSPNFGASDPSRRAAAIGVPAAMVGAGLVAAAVAVSLVARRRRRARRGGDGAGEEGRRRAEPGGGGQAGGSREGDEYQQAWTM